MSHLHQEILAGIALGEPEPMTKRDQLHLRTCRHCAAELAELRAIVATGRGAKPYDLRPPRPAVLALIQADLATDVVLTDDPHEAAAAGLDGSVADLDSDERGDDLARRRAAARPRTRRLATAAIAAAALIAVSVGGVLWYRQTAADNAVVVARATLAPLPDKSGEGTAQLVRSNGVDQLAVTVTTQHVGAGFEELWLINTDGKRMISLGVVPPDGRGSYPVPTASGGVLDGYTIVDISLEPFDGNAAHSHNSLLRGTLD